MTGSKTRDAILFLKHASEITLLMNRDCGL